MDYRKIRELIKKNEPVFQATLFHCLKYVFGINVIPFGCGSQGGFKIWGKDVLFCWRKCEGSADLEITESASNVLNALIDGIGLKMSMPGGKKDAVMAILHAGSEICRMPVSVLQLHVSEYKSDMILMRLIRGD